MKLSSSLISFRPAVETDLGFIIKTWLASYRESPFGKQFPEDTYESIQKAAILNFIQNNQVLIAHVPEDTDSLIGFICYNNNNPMTIVHYVYVKFVYRNSGIAQMLLEHIQPSTHIVCTQINRKFYELRSMNFLPMMTIREYDDLPDNSINGCNQWFINKLQEFRDHRVEILRDRNQKAYQRKQRKVSE